MSFFKALVSLFTPKPAAKPAVKPVAVGDDGMTDYIRNPTLPSQAPWNTSTLLPLLAQVERDYGIPQNLLKEQARQESNFNPSALNKGTGASGLMQIIPRWHPDVDVWDPKSAVPYAADYLKQNYKRFGTWGKALAAYNWGPSNLSKLIASKGSAWLSYVPLETRNYVTGILGRAGQKVA